MYSSLALLSEPYFSLNQFSNRSSPSHPKLQALSQPLLTLCELSACQKAFDEVLTPMTSPTANGQVIVGILKDGGMCCVLICLIRIMIRLHNAILLMT